MNNIPSIAVVDGFEDAEALRAEALKAEFQTDYTYYKGARSVKSYKTDLMKERFEQILGIKIKDWNLPTNGKFQYTTVLDPIIYHSDLQRWAAALYLTPNAPPDAGTSFYMPRENGIKYEKDHIHYDKTSFNECDKIANFFGRLVIWPGKALHSASAGFGDKLENSRLSMVFFFE